MSQPVSLLVMRQVDLGLVKSSAVPLFTLSRIGGSTVIVPVPPAKSPIVMCMYPPSWK